MRTRKLKYIGGKLVVQQSGYLQGEWRKVLIVLAVGKAAAVYALSI